MSDSKVYKDGPVEGRLMEAARLYEQSKGTDVYGPLNSKPINPLNQQTGGDHYKKMKIQPVEFIHANNIPFIEGSVIKYVSRWKSKNGIQDLEKAKHFIDLLIQLEKEKR